MFRPLFIMPHLLLCCLPAFAQTESTSEVRAPLTVETQVLRGVTSIEMRWQFTGTVQPARRSELSFERVGRIDRMLAEEGDLVAAGDLLAELNVDQLHAQLKKLAADRLAAEALLKELKAGTRTETLAAARAAVAEQQVQWENAKANLTRRQRLHQQKLISLEEVETALTAVRRLQASLEGAQQKLNELEAGTRTEKIESQAAIVDAITAGSEAIRVEIEHSQLVSPYAGTIIARNYDEGSVASPGKTVFTLIETPKLEAQLGIPVETAKLLKVNDQVDLAIREVDVKGTVRAILQSVDESTRTQKVLITLPEGSEQQFVTGEIARLNLVREQPASGYWLPTQALMRGTRGLWECFVVSKLNQQGLGTVDKRNVEIIHTEGERVLVRGAIADGDHVISNAVHRVTSGQQVQVRSREGAS